MELHPTILELVNDIDAFLSRTGITRTDFGRLSIGDPNLYRHLRNGRNPRLPTMDRIHNFMRRHPVSAREISSQPVTLRG